MGIVTSDGAVSSDLKESVQDRETWKPSISGNIFTEYKLNSNSRIGLGLGFQNNGERIVNTSLSFGDEVDPVFGFGGVNLTEVGVVHNHNNLEINVFYKRNFSKRFYVLVGSSSLINMSNTITSKLVYSNGTTKKNTIKDISTDFRKFNISANFGIGIDYVSNDKLSLFVHPLFQYGFLGISKTASLNRNFFSAGISTGIRI